ncbi:MAG: hypothetical protein ACJ77K_11470 [Bacteroidia bacterium]
MEDHEKSLREYLVGRTLQHIEFFDMDLEYASPDMDRIWVVDGGVQFSFDEEEVSFGFASGSEFFDLSAQPIWELCDEHNLDSLGATDVEGINALIGATITDVEVIWNYYQLANEAGEPDGEKKYMPVELLLHFSNGSFLQLAAIDYEIKSGKLTDLSYESGGELLISLNERLKISTIEN